MIYIVGIGGIGTSALAQWLKHRGKNVAGNDQTESDITRSLEKLDIKVHIGAVGTLPEPVKLLIYSDAVPATHHLRAMAREKNIAQLSYAAMLGKLSQDYTVIALAGSHGKSTTTSLTGLLFEDLGLDPTVIDGTRVPQWQHNGRLGNFRPGQSKYLVVEADEYQNHFHYLKPAVAVITSLDHDHIDAFPTKESYLAAFQKFIENITIDGTLIVEHSLRAYIEQYAGSRKIVSYSLSDPAATITASKIEVKNEKQYFSVKNIEFELGVPGIHMVANTLAAMAAGQAITDAEKVFQAAQITLKNFNGTWRRFEKLKEHDTVLYFSDYAHHPTELEAVIKAAHQLYAAHRLVLVFQPHQIQRAQAFEKEFKKVFREALSENDLLLLCPIYEVLGREKDLKFSAADWIQEAPGLALYMPTLEDMPQTIKKYTQPGDLVLFTGAGSIDALARKFIETLGK